MDETGDVRVWRRLTAEEVAALPPMAWTRFYPEVMYHAAHDGKRWRKRYDPENLLVALIDVLEVPPKGPAAPGDDRVWRDVTAVELMLLAGRADVQWYTGLESDRTTTDFADVDGLRYCRVKYATEDGRYRFHVTVLAPPPALWREATSDELMLLFDPGALSWHRPEHGVDVVYTEWQGLSWRMTLGVLLTGPTVRIEVRA